MFLHDVDRDRFTAVMTVAYVVIRVLYLILLRNYCGRFLVIMTVEVVTLSRLKL
jgi:hypothetical protein